MSANKFCFLKFVLDIQTGHYTLVRLNAICSLSEINAEMS